MKKESENKVADSIENNYTDSYNNSYNASYDGSYSYDEAYSGQEYVEENNYEGNGDVLTASGGVANGPSGYETYYNLPMGGVVDNMREMGYSESDYPYWTRDDGVKMLGDYVMVAANVDERPYGTIVESSLGEAIVCDTGGFADENPSQLDVAVDW